MRHWITLARERLDLRDERGIALVMAIGIMFVLTIALTTTIYFSSASARHANTSNAGQKAYALAEAGVNNAIAQIAVHYPNPTTAGDPTWGASPGPVTDSIGTTSWSGLFDGVNTWTVTGIGAVKNPTGGADITRTVTAKIPVTLEPPPFTKYGLFVDDDPGGCTRLRGGNTITVPVYAKGCLDLSSNTSIEEPATFGPTTVSVNVGELQVGGGGHIGTVSRKINWLGADTCNGVPCPSGDVHAETYAARAPVSLPKVDLDAQYARANWSAATCDPLPGSNPFDNTTGPGKGVRDNSLGTVNLMGPSYNCTAWDASGTVVGLLGWNDSSTTPLPTPTGPIPPKTLRVSGAVFIDGDLGKVGGNNYSNFTYSGNGTIYFNGKFAIQKAKICGPGSGFVGSNCARTWDPVNGALLLVAGNCDPAVAGKCSPAANAIDTGTDTELEAGIWAIGNVDATADPYLGGSVYLDKGISDFTGGGGMKAFVNLPAGAPTGGEYTLGAAKDFAGG
jgi:hypothetical protein